MNFPFPQIEMLAGYSWFGVDAERVGYNPSCQVDGSWRALYEGVSGVAPSYLHPGATNAKCVFWDFSH